MELRLDGFVLLVGSFPLLSHGNEVWHRWPRTDLHAMVKEYMSRTFLDSVLQVYRSILRV